MLPPRDAPQFGIRRTSFVPSQKDMCIGFLLSPWFAVQQWPLFAQSGSRACLFSEIDSARAAPRGECANELARE